MDDSVPGSLSVMYLLLAFAELCMTWHILPLMPFSIIRNISTPISNFDPSYLFSSSITAQMVKFSIKDFFIKSHQIRRKLRIWSHLANKSLMENLLFLQCMSTMTVLAPIRSRLDQVQNFSVHLFRKL